MGLYSALIGGILSNKLKQITLPHKSPDEDESVPISLKITKFCGVVLAVLLFTVIGLHCLVSLPLFCCFLCCVSVFDYGGRLAGLAGIMASMGSGALISPIVVVSCLLFETDYWDEIQSWMVAYIAWGLFSFCITLSMLIAPFSFLKSILDIVTLLIGVDFENFDVSTAMEGEFGWSGLAVLFYSLLW